MFEKIISGGQTGADRAALDVALKLGIDHGGYIPRGRRSEAGPVPGHYQLVELDSDSYPDRTAKNVVEGDGTVIVSHGPLDGGSALTRKLAQSHGKPFIHIDLTQTTKFDAALTLADWISSQSIRVLNVAGPRASKDPKIYQATADLLESTYYLYLTRDGQTMATRPESAFAPLPRTIETAVERLEREMPLKDRTTLANMTDFELEGLESTLGRHIGERYEIWSENDALVGSCHEYAAKERLDVTDPPMIIIFALWEKLKNTHKLRIVK